MFKSKFVDALSEFNNILTMEQKAVVWCSVKQVWFFIGQPVLIGPPP